MTWTKDSNGLMRHSDGVRVLRGGAPKKPYVVENALGVSITQRSRGGSFVQDTTFASQEAAMEAADRAWPMVEPKTDESGDEPTDPTIR